MDEYLNEQLRTITDNGEKFVVQERAKGDEDLRQEMVGRTEHGKKGAQPIWAFTGLFVYYAPNFL